MKLKAKFRLLYWALTALIFAPVALLVVAYLMCYYLLPPTRSRLCLSFIKASNALLEWRWQKVYWYVTNRRPGFSLPIDEKLRKS